MLPKKYTGLFLLFMALLLLWQCKREEENEFRLISFQGSSVDRFTSFYGGYSSLDSLGYAGIVTREDELITAGGFIFSVRQDMPDSLSFREIDSLMYINGDLAGISISQNGPPLSFFEQLPAGGMSHLRTIIIASPIGDSMKPVLKEIAAVNPGVDIFYSAEVESGAHLTRDLVWLSQYFRPRALLIGSETDAISFSGLKKFPSIEMLLVMLPTNGNSAIPHLRRLKELIVFNNEDGTSIGSELFDGNPGLERLAIISYEEADIDWDAIGKLKNLRSLNIQAPEVRLDNLYEQHPQLRSLQLVYGEGSSLSGIFKKNKLKWLSFSPADDASLGENAEALERSFPELKYLEFDNEDSLLDYRNFKNLKKLKYLVVREEVGLASTLASLDHLSYLSLPEEFLKDSVNRAKLQKALPNTVITPNSGACLGSGWLLLLLPLAGLWFYFLKLKKPEH